jgi:hypothetical protein
VNKLDEYRKKLCGIHLINQEQINLDGTENLKATTKLDALDLNKMYEDLKADNCSTESIESISKLIAELAKDGIFGRFFYHYLVLFFLFKTAKSF